MPYISAVYNDPRYAGRVQFIGIDFSDTYDIFARFREDHPSLDVRFPLVHDRNRRAKDAYGGLHDAGELHYRSHGPHQQRAGRALRNRAAPGRRSAAG